MQSKSYNKSIIREILSSKARFASILLIIFLGVAFFSGIKSSSPDMDYAINEYYNKYNLMDSKIIATLGLTQNDLDLLENNDEILSYQATHSIDVNVNNLNNVIKFIEYNPNESKNINDFVIVQGRLPENSGEIAVDEMMLKANENLKIGDKFIIESDQDTMSSLKKSEYTIVGFVNSPIYIEKVGSRGTTTVGKGSVDYFAVLNSEDISMDVYTEIYVKFKNVQGLQAYSDEYKHKMEENTKYLEELFKDRGIGRVEEIRLEAKDELEKAENEIKDGEQKLLDAQNEIDKGKEELEYGKIKYANGLNEYENKIKNGKAQIASAEKQIEAGQKELDSKKKDIELGENKINQAKNELEKAKEQFLGQGINPDESLEEYENQLKNLNTLVENYNSLTNDINTTVNNVGSNKLIPYEKVQYWKGIINNPSLGLDSLNSLILELEKDLSNIQLASSISAGIDSINNSIRPNISKLEELIANVNTYKIGKAEYEKQLEIFNNGKLQFKQAQATLNSSREQINKSKQELLKGEKQGKEELEKAKLEIEESEKKLADGEKKIQENKIKLEDGKSELEAEKEKLNDIKESTYYFFDRTDNSGYSGYADAIKSIDNIASVFPLFFFLVAILICLTTMTRMVEEKRIEIGTLKALGYNNFEISKKYIVYSASASIIGCILGIIVGCNLFPNIINSAYQSMYSLPQIVIKYYPEYIAESVFASIFCTVGAAMFVLKNELKDIPSQLMKVKAPKIGKKILLERITPLWKRLNFNQKVTLRNLFRYKQRMIMTVLGISGCMAMLITGFSLQKSNTELMERQFNKIWSYQSIVVFNDEYSEEDNNEYNTVLNSISSYRSALNVHQELVTFSKENMNKQTVTLFSPENVEDLEEYILLNHRESGEKYNLTNDGVIINEKLAKLLGVSKGDIITMVADDNNSYEVKVANISESYTGHSLYISPTYYKEIFKNAPKFNAQLLRLDSEMNDELSAKLMDTNKVINVTSMTSLTSASEESSESLNVVMVVIIIASGALAFIVLYNLNNINVSERVRELSTIKVLGFYNDEVTMYISRENIILTLMGVVTGSFMGKILYLFIINTAELDNMMMVPEVFVSSYVLAGVITIFFSILVMFIMHTKLKNINMIDALKSNE